MRSYAIEDRLEAGKPDVEYIEKTLPEHEWQRYGFGLDMTLDEVVTKMKTLNTTTKNRDLVERKARFKHVASEQRKDMLESAYLPEYIVKEFESKLINDTLSLDTGKSKKIYHWRTAMKVIAKLGIAPENWGENRMPILVALKGYAPSTVSKQVHLLNFYGSFYCKKFSRFYEPIQVKSGDLAKLGDHYLKKTGGRTKEALGVTLADMAKIKLSEEFTDEEKRWCVICLGFGLRPSEVEMITTMSHGPKTIIQKASSVVIYQPKLTNLPHNKRYKEVVLTHPFQKEALRVFRSGKSIKMPSLYMIRKVLKSDEYGRYSFRKGYEEIMETLGSDFIRASKDLGHASIERTWRSYRKRISLKDD